MKTVIAQKNVASIGEEVGIELGTEMIRNYQTGHSGSTAYVIGKNIIEKILSQPNCAGLKLYDAYNEEGQKVLVYVGVDSRGKSLLEYTTINYNGQLTIEKGIVADRGIRTTGIIFDEPLEWWEND